MIFKVKNYSDIKRLNQATFFMEDNLLKLNPIDRLDKILNILMNDSYLSDRPIAEKLGWNVGYTYIHEVIAQLVLDGYANDNKGVYTITFKGRLFIENGGYRNLNNKRDSVLELPLLVNIAVVLSGLYYSFEIIRIYFEPIFQYFCNCNFAWQK